MFLFVIRERNNGMIGKHYSGIVICLAAIMALSVGGCKSKSDEVSDIDKLQGTWVGTETGNQGGQWTFVISGSEIDVKGPDPEAYSGTLKLNAEADPKEGFISNESPMGSALLGHKIGEFVEVIAPAGAIQYRIVKIK